jgi:hypothetical protein
MFEGLIDPATCGDLTPAAMVDAIGAFHRAEATMVAHKWTMIARLLADHQDSAAAEENTWAYDGWNAVRDQVGPAMRLSPRRASTQMRLAEGLARCPKMAALLAAGVINIRVAETLIYRTELLAPSVQDIVDTEIAAQAGGYTLLSDDDLVLAVDAIIEEHDPDAVRRYKEAAQSCDVGFGKRDDATGTASMYGRISAADAELGWRVLEALAATVCNNDPRSKGELRAAAQGAVYARRDRLVCQCGAADCVAATLPSAVPSAVIHVLAEQGALEQVLAQIEALRQAQPTDPAAPPSIDYEALAREADAAEAARTATPPQAPPWETTTEPEPRATPEAEPEPEPEVAPEAEAEAQAAPTAGGDTDWSHWFTRDTDTDTGTGAGAGEPPWARSATAPGADEAGDDDAVAADRTAPTIPTEPPTTNPQPKEPEPEEPELDPVDDADPEPDGDPDSEDDGGGEPPWGGGSSPQPPPEPTDPDGGGADAATPDTDTAQVTGRAPHRHSTTLPPQVPAAFTAPRRPRPAVTLGGTLIPLDQLADMLRDGATIKALPIPTAAPATGYKFTGTAREFIQCRDIRCRFPGCNRKAEYADIDHTVAHGDGGATHPSNGKALCREHHLAKTFGVGWRDEQLPTGEVRWTAPTGHTYSTQPTTRVLFPDWDPTTAALPPPTGTRRRKPAPGITMPIRTRTREQDRQQHIKAERDYNALQRALGKPARRPPF